MAKSILTITIYLFMSLLSLGSRTAWAKSTDEKVNPRAWLAWGDLRGHMEPCGCSPETDLGGIRRIASAIEQDRARHGPLNVYVLGNLLAEDPASDKDPVILEGLAHMPVSAILFNRLERAKGALIADWQKKHGQGLPWLWSNPAGHLPTGLTVAKVITTPSATILGYASGGEPYGPSLAAAWKKALTQAGYKILLFSGTNAELKAIAQAGLFDDIIVANQTPLKTEPTPLEKEEPGRLLILGRYYAVPSFGQGVLRGGALREGAGKAVIPLLKGAAGGAGATGLPAATGEKAVFSPKGTGENLVLWLDRAYEDGSPLKSVTDAYVARQAQAFAAKRQARLALLKDTPYAGARACQSCHPAAYKAWQASRHAHAFATLQRVGKDQVAECVTCHVLALDKPGGFVSLADTPGFAGVQCETCHGPRLAHTRDPAKPMPNQPDPKTVCVSCHKTPHSYRFEFENYWPKIKHGQG